VDGTGAAADNGIMQIRYHNSLAKLKIRTEGSNLHFYNVTGCAGLINSGDAITVASAYLVTRRKPSPGPDHDPSLQQGPGAPKRHDLPRLRGDARSA